MERHIRNEQIIPLVDGQTKNCNCSSTYRLGRFVVPLSAHCCWESPRIRELGGEHRPVRAGEQESDGRTSEDTSFKRSTFRVIILKRQSHAILDCENGMGLTLV